MTDAELKAWWPDLGTVVDELRKSDWPAVADLLVDAVRAGATSGEVLDGVGGVLREHRSLRAKLTAPAVTACDAVMADVYRAYPGLRLAHWFARLTRRKT
jgi:hypothetical protein